MIARTSSIAIVLIAICFVVGCSKSSTTQGSSESSSKLSSSPFKSSSSSSPDDEEEGQEEETAYQRDVRNYTVEVARIQRAHDVDIESFQRDLSAIAAGYGIADWERDEGTYVAVGRGLGESELDDWSVKQLAVALSSEDYDRLALLRSGYESRRDP